jgi:4-amino-4-deoxy-L-arabinose transferase-like glycosyltransferase
MTQERTIISARVRSLAKVPGHLLALTAVLVLSAFLNLFRLTNEGYGNPFYAAAVKDMLTSWHNFFFVSFDAGFVSVDKPPLGLWIQAASAELFGFHGWSLLLPQALAGVLSVALLYHLVSRTFGPVAGLVAALVLAVTPIAVAVDRTNLLDSLLVLTVLVAAWAVLYAAETGRLRWLLVGVVVVGLGFNVKMLEAYLVLPAFYLLYLVAAPLGWWRRLVHLGVATIVLLVVSLSWAAVVDLTPADQRPYIGNSSNNSELNLIVGWNGAARLLGGGLPGGGVGGAADSQSTQQLPSSQGGFQGGSPGGVGFVSGLISGENGNPGPFRLLNEQLAGQIGWLLPLALVGFLAASWQRRPHLPLDRQHQAPLLWGMWLLTMVAFFSVAGIFHRYYLVMLAPAIAALVGIGVVRLWKDYRSPGWRGWLLPLTLVGIGILHVYILSYYGDWSRWLTPPIAGLCLLSAVGLVFMRLRPKLKASAYPLGAAAVGILALLVAPTAWAATTLQREDVTGVTSPFAGPDVPGNNPSAFHNQTSASSSGKLLFTIANPLLMNYLQAHQGSARYLLAASNAPSATPIILQTNEPVISIGGIIGRDPVLSTNKLANLVNEGDVRFFLIMDMERMMETILSSRPSGQQGASLLGAGDFLQNESISWVRDNCKAVPRELWQSPPNSDEQGALGLLMSAQQLYDCGTGD